MPISPASLHLANSPLASSPPNMTCFLCRRRSGVADSRATRTTAGRRRKARASTGAGKKNGPRRCRRLVAEEAAVAGKLQALKELMPSTRWRESGEGSAAAALGLDRLFEEAAVYIILLKARVGGLQKLLDEYGSSV